MNNTVAHHKGQFLIYWTLMGKNYNISFCHFIELFSSNNISKLKSICADNASARCCGSRNAPWLKPSGDIFHAVMFLVLHI